MCILIGVVPPFSLVWLISNGTAFLGLRLSVLARAFGFLRRSPNLGGRCLSSHVVIELVKVLGDGGCDLLEGVAVAQHHGDGPAN